MAANLSDFVSFIKKNSIARTNRYRITFTLPDGVAPSRGSATYEQTLSLTCLIADIPGVQNQTTAIDYGNYDRKVTFGRSISDFNTTFLLTGKYAEKRVFDAWYRLINDESQHAVEYYDNYVATIQVDCLNERDEIVYTFELTEAYPIAISNLRLDRTAQNQQMVLDIVWAFHRINYSNVDSTIKSTIEQGIVVSNTTIGAGSGVLRTDLVPSVGSLSSALQAVVASGNEAGSQVSGALAAASSIRAQVLDKAIPIPGAVNLMNGLIKDTNKLNLPSGVKTEVLSVLSGTKNRIAGI